MCLFFLQCAGNIFPHERPPDFLVSGETPLLHLDWEVIKESCEMYFPDFFDIDLTNANDCAIITEPIREAEKSNRNIRKGRVSIHEKAICHSAYADHGAGPV